MLLLLSHRGAQQLICRTWTKGVALMERVRFRARSLVKQARSAMLRQSTALWSSAAAGARPSPALTFRSHSDASALWLSSRPITSNQNQPTETHQPKPTKANQSLSPTPHADQHRAALRCWHRAWRRGWGLQTDSRPALSAWSGERPVLLGRRS